MISGLIDRTFIDITQLGCPELADISLPAISCTFECHKSKHVCALRTSYSLAGSTFTLLVCNMQGARLSLVIINVFQMTGLLRRTYYLNEQEKVCLHLPQ